MPDFSLEDKHGYLVCGLDEVGRGPLAGPVISACVHIPSAIRTLPFVKDLNDSKKLSLKKREMLFDLIKEHCVYGTGTASVQEIDSMNILQASLLSMKRAYEVMSMPMDFALIDGNQLTKISCNQQTVIKGDSVSFSIAAASILAKVTRDRLMSELDSQYPGYGWLTNAGYGSKMHMDAIQKLGVTPHHRTSFAPVRRKIEETQQRDAS